MQTHLMLLYSRTRYQEYQYKFTDSRQGVNLTFNELKHIAYIIVEPIINGQSVYPVLKIIQKLIIS